LPMSTSDQWRVALEFYESEKRLQYEQAKFLFEQSRTYQAVIMGLAYGGFFALWSSTNSFVQNKGISALAAALMLISILAFALWTILNMYMLAQVTLKHAGLAKLYDKDPQSHEELLARTKLISEKRHMINAEIRDVTVRLAMFWRPFFYTSLILGVIAALIMLVVLVTHSIESLAL